jgi:outer membrane lipoprotein LolB
MCPAATRSRSPRRWARRSRASNGTPEESIAFPDGRIERAADADSLAARAIGVRLPVESLAWWIRASPHARSPYAIERDASGRVAVLRQDGWTLVYAYADDARQPFRVLATWPDVDVRVVIDAWD